MTENSASFLAEVCNKFGVLVQYEINGIQHEFKFDTKKLSPTNVVYEKNIDHISGATYNLLPTNIASQIKSIGRKLFDPKVYYSKAHKTNNNLTMDDYVRTEFGKYLRIDSINKFKDRIREIESEMKAKADELISNRYAEYYRSSFVTAYQYFSGGMEEFRELSKKYSESLPLFWHEVKIINDELQKLEIEFQSLNPKRSISLQYLARYCRKQNLPALQASLKLKHVPQSKGEYLNGLSVAYLLVGFHPRSFINKAWKDKYKSINSYDRTIKYLFSVEEKMKDIQSKA